VPLYVGVGQMHPTHVVLSNVHAVPLQHQ